MRINKSFIALTSSDASVAWSNITGTPTTLSGYGITDGVPTSRTLTINGVSYDLSANRTWTISTGTVTSVALATGTTGTDVNVSGSPITSSGTITLNIPNAGMSARGLVTTSTQTFNGIKTFNRETYFSNFVDFNSYAVIQKLTLASGSPASGKGYIWYNNVTNTLYFRNDANTDFDLTLGGTTTGSGTTNYIPKWTSSSALGNSLIYDNGTNILISSTTDSGEKLQVNGSGKITSTLLVGNTIKSTSGDQTTSRITIENTGTNGKTVNLIAGNPNVDQTGFSIAYGNTNILRFDNNNAATISNLAGTGTRMVVADSSGVLSALTIVTSGTYTPTLTNVANISSSFPDLSTYTRIGDIVAVQGFLTLTPTSGSLTTTIGISLPIASNFNAGTDASGIYVSTSNDRFGGINPDQTNDRVEISFTSSSNGTRNFYFSFQYQIK